MWKWSGTITSKRTVPQGKSPNPPTPPPPSVREEGRPPSDSPRQCRFSGFTQGATQRRNTQEPKRAFGVHMIKSQTSDSPSEKKNVSGRIHVSLNYTLAARLSGCVNIKILLRVIIDVGEDNRTYVCRWACFE